MKPKEILWVLFLAIAALILNGKPTWSQSVGGTQSERSGGRQSNSATQRKYVRGSTDPSKTEKGLWGRANRERRILLRRHPEREKRGR